MNLRWIGLTLLALITVWLQTTLLPPMLGLVPNLMIVTVVFVAAFRPASEAILVAIGGGVLLDLTSGADFGLRMAFYSVLALVVILLVQTGAEFDNLGLVMLVVLVASVLYNVSVLSSIVAAQAVVNWAEVARRIGLEATINLGAALVLGPMMKRMMRRPAGLPQIVRG